METDARVISEQKQAIAKLTWDNEQDLLLFIPWASRLAGCGDNSDLSRLAEVMKPFESNFEQLMLRRVEEGLWDLDPVHSFGDILADFILDAQDYACFLELSPIELPESVRNGLKRWIGAANALDLNRHPDGREIKCLLQRFKKVFVLESRFQIPVLAKA